MNDIVTKIEPGTALETSGFLDSNVTLAVQLTRAEVDQQVATAKAYPRDLTRVVRDIKTLISLDEETADECIYALPRGGKSIEGPSIRFAEIVFSQWGNCRVGSRVVEVNLIEKYVEAEGIFHDLQTNAASTERVRRRITDREGRLLKEDMIIVTGNACRAIAKRNSILAGIPKAIYKQAYVLCEEILRGDIETLPARRDKAFKAFAAFGIAPEQIFQALGIAGVDDLNLDHFVTLTGIRNAIKSGDLTIEEAFPKQGAKLVSNTADARLDKAIGKKVEPAHDPQTGEIKEEPKPVEKKTRQKRAEKAQEPVEQETSSEAASEASEPASDVATQQDDEYHGGGADADIPFEPDTSVEPEPEQNVSTSNPIFEAGKIAAAEGFVSFKKWKNRLTQRDLDTLTEAQLNELTSTARQVAQ